MPVSSQSPVPADPQVPVGSGYVDPLRQIPMPVQLMDLSAPADQSASPVSAGQAVHSFDPPPIPVTPSQGSIHKEFEPRPQMQEATIAHEPLPEIPPQVVEAGVEHSPEVTSEKTLHAEITKATQDLSTQVAPIPSAAPVQASPDPVFPLTKMEAEEVLKTDKPDTGRRWIATEVLKQLKEYFGTKQTDPL